MTRPSEKHDSWVMWLTAAFALIAFAVFAFAIIRQRSDRPTMQPLQTTPDSAPPTTPVDGEFSVVRVHDGDSLTLVGADGLEISVRLRGIDAPELGQPYGYEAKQALQSLLDAGTVGLSDPAKGKYGRYVADMHLGDTWVNQAMVAEGHAWCDQVNSFNRTLYSAEQQAKSEGRGLWASPTPDPPWIWRSEHK
ncbi:MAG: thermonuclease family protein [Verrucomicrobia bacterium]|nr:thermonuclease family protein [Verrucomicrobiota bacterium]